MLKFVIKFTIIFSLIFTITNANANTKAKFEPGVIEFVFQSTGNCFNKTDVISVKGKTCDLISVIIVDEYGRKVLNKQMPFKSSTIQLNIPCGFYNLKVVDLKRGNTKNYPIMLQ